MNDGRVGLKTIAEKCGVSVMTVSRALDPRRKDRLRASTRARVIEVARELGYRSNIAARRLKTRRAETITLILRDRLSLEKVALDFDAYYEHISFSVMRGALKGAREYNYDIKFELAPFDEPLHLRASQTDGILFATILGMEFLLDEVQEAGMPYLVLDGGAGDLGPEEGAGVAISREPGMTTAFAHLLESGRRRVAFIGAAAQKSSDAKRRVLRNYLLDAGFCDESLFYEASDIFDLRGLLDGFNGCFPFDAVFCSNDVIADLTVRELETRGVGIPNDVSVLGFDGNSAFQGDGSINLSTVYVPWEEASAEAVRTLIHKIENGNEVPAFTKTLPTRFIKGDTT